MRNKYLTYGSIFLLLLVSFYYILTTTSYIRYWADDFCSSVFLRNNGYWGSQLAWWNSWTGRYSYIAILDLFLMFGSIGAKILPIILTPFVLPYVIVSPEIIQTFYWMTGSLNYAIPFAFLNIFFLLLFSKNKKYYKYLAFLLMFVATGFSESFGVATLALLIFIYIVIYLSNDKNKIEKFRIILFGFVATLLSLVLMYFAPGNAARSATVSHPESIIALVKDTVVYSRWYLTHLLYIKSFVLSVLAVVSSVFAFGSRKVVYFKKPYLVLVLSLLFIVGITLLVVGLTYQAMNWEPPMRVMSIVNNMILLASVVFGFSLFDILKNKLSQKYFQLIFAFLVILLTFQINNNWKNVRTELQSYSIKWDVFEKNVLNSKTGIVETENIKPVGKLDGFVENKGWVTSCIKSYYGLNEIIIK